MDSEQDKSFKLTNIRMDKILKVFQAFESNPNLLEEVDLDDNMFSREESFILKNIRDDRNNYLYYKQSESFEDLKQRIDSTLQEGNKELEKKKELESTEGLGFQNMKFEGDFEDDFSELDLTDELDIMSALEELDGMGMTEDLSSILEEEHKLLEGSKIDAKKVNIVLNGHEFPMYFIENNIEVLSIFNLEPHKLAFLWTFPELEPVMNIPALMKLIKETEVQDEKLDINYKDPNMIEFRLLKGLLALEVKGGR